MEDGINHEIIDVDDLDLVCTGVRHIVRIDRPPSPRPRKNKRRPEVINLLDSDDGPGISGSSTPRTGLSQSHSKELHFHREAERLILPPSKRQASAAIIAALNRSGRRGLKRKASASTIEILSEDEDIIPVKRTKHESLGCRRTPSDGTDWVEPQWECGKDDARRTKLEEQCDSSLAQPVEPSLPSEDDATRHHGHTKLESYEPEYPHMMEAALPRQPSNDDATHGDIIDSGDDCVNFLASLDISDEANWLPLPACNKAEDLTPECVPKRAFNKPLPLDALVPQFHSAVNYDRLHLKRSSQKELGKMVKVFGTARYLRPFQQSRRRDAIPLAGCARSPKLYYDLSFDKIGIIVKYPHLSSGVISKIVQAPGKIVVCSAVIAGNADYSDDENQLLPPENKAGTLVVYNHDHSKSNVGGNSKLPPGSESIRKVQAHYSTRMTDRGPSKKYFCVNDIAFNPNNTSQFLSTGLDFSAQVWEIPRYEQARKNPVAPRMIRKLSFNDAPQDIVYKDDSSVLAIPCTDGVVPLYNTRQVFEDSSDTPFALHCFRVAPNRTNQAAGATVWGKESTQDHLFTSSEPRGDENAMEDTATGYHYAWDAHKCRKVFDLDAKEPGNASEISPDGSILVLITGGPGLHPLRLYDVRRRIRKAYAREELEPYSERSSSSYNPDDHSGLLEHARFSPDGRLLAVTRGDNRLHVYDIRVLSRGPLCRFEHCDSDVGGGRAYGVVEAQWVEGRDRRRIGIVSGGNDGCVRLWEPSLAPGDNLQGAVIGRTDFDVAHFSMGDGCKGEMPMVIGDSGGGLHIYDLMDGEGCAIRRS